MAYKEQMCLIRVVPVSVPALAVADSAMFIVKAERGRCQSTVERNTSNNVINECVEHVE